ncbi:hypothetical protein BV22DRAFT_1041574 [Leucogyrophana mollusca]|uniref:Uncharacterized protein n=1 Tax=Leucogyrophana mollusca TaxID=85980 RepID=A0ACB8B0B8_9AGAM|nr:hypothetical protein BV22DRAFT_1041574 [Leucogyrophana mollusca]
MSAFSLGACPETDGLVALTPSSCLPTSAPEKEIPSPDAVRLAPIAAEPIDHRPANHKMPSRVQMECSKLRRG